MLTEVPHGVLLANMSGLGLFKFSLSRIDLIIQFSALVEALDSASLVPLRGILLICVHSLNRSISDLVEYLRGILSLPLLGIRGHNGGAEALLMSWKVRRILTIIPAPRCEEMLQTCAAG